MFCKVVNELGSWFLLRTKDLRKHAISAISEPLVMYMHDDSRAIVEVGLSDFLCHFECTLYPSIVPTATRTEKKKNLN